MAALINEILDRREMQTYLRGVADVDLEWVLDEVELTGDESPPPLPSWGSSQTGSVRLTSGKVVAVSIYSGGTSHGDVFDLGRRDGVWNIRIYRKALQHAEFTADIVSFTLLKLQFWPAGA